MRWPRGAQGGQALLRRLQWRLSGGFVAVACLGLVTFVVVLEHLDDGFAGERQSAALRAQASRAAALVYLDGKGLPRTDGIRDDVVATGPGALTVFAAPGRGSALKVLLVTGGADPSRVEPLARTALQDAAEEGSTARLATPAGPARAVAMPWFDKRGVAGAVVATAPVEAQPRGELLSPAIGAAGALLLLLTLTGLWLIRRSVRPALAALEDRERFLATAAHELRAPLARLRAGAESARRTVDRSEPVARVLDRLVSVADNAGHVVANLLLATRIEHSPLPLQQAPVRLDVLAGELETAFGCLVDVSEPVTVTGDAALLRHAMVNLVENALRHGKVGEVAPDVLVRLARGHDGVVLQVVDDGPGFPPGVDVLARYATGPGGGTGLGLPLVQWIVEQHGATLELANRDGGRYGAVVTVTFPPARQAAGAATRRPRAVPRGRPAGRGRRPVGTTSRPD